MQVMFVGEESGDGTRDGSKLVYRPRLKRGRGYNAARWTHDAFCVSLRQPPPGPVCCNVIKSKRGMQGRSCKFTGKAGPHDFLLIPTFCGAGTGPGLLEFPTSFGVKAGPVL